MSGNVTGENVLQIKEIEDYFWGVVNDDKDIDSDGNDDNRLGEIGGEHDKWVENLLKQELLLGNCKYGNYPKCFCMGLPGYPCPRPKCGFSNMRHFFCKYKMYNIENMI